MNKRKSKHLKGKIVTFVQLVLSLIFIATVINNGLIPMKYIVLSGIILLIMFALTFGLQFVKHKLNILVCSSAYW